MSVEPRASELPEALFDGLGGPAREFLLQLLLYKSVFMGSTFRSLVERESSDELKARLRRINEGSPQEAEAIARLVGEWDRHPGTWEHVSLTIQQTRAQLLHDLIRLKEGMTESALFAALRAPTASLRDRFLALADSDRRQADELRAFLGVVTTDELREAQEHGLGAHDARDRRSSLSAAMRARLRQLEAKGAKGRRVVVSLDGLRHLRDERAISEDGRWHDLPIDIDVGWEGDVYAIETDERVTYAELVVSMKTSGAGPS